MIDTQTAPAVTAEPTTEQVIAGLQARIISLEAMGSEIKLPVSDADFDAELAKMETENSASIALASPPAHASLSLTKAFGHPVAMTEGQKAKWEPFRNKWKDAFSAKHRTLVPERKRMFERIQKDPKAFVSTSARVSKAGEELTSSLRVTRKAKPHKVKGHGKGAAKPAQVAAQVPAAGNAVNPATL